MKIYHLSQTDNDGYDTYSDCVVIARSPKDAKTIHPSGDENVYDGRYHAWGDWADSYDGIECIEIGIAHKSQKRGVVCHSFHAG